MRQYDIENEQAAKPQHYEWHQVFSTLFTHPSVETFQQLLKDPEAKAQRAYLWMLLPNAMSGITLLTIHNSQQNLRFDWFTIIIIGAIFGSLFGLIRFIVSGWLMQRVAVFLGGNEQGFGQFHYARGTYMPVMTVAYIFVRLLMGNNLIVVSIVFATLLTIELFLTNFALQAVNSTLTRYQILLLTSFWYFIVIIFISI